MPAAPIHFFEWPGKPLEVWIDAWPDWDRFDNLVALLTTDYGATVRAAIDGPDARRWILDIDGAVFELIHDDPWGNYLVATTAAGEAVIRRVGCDLARRLPSITSG